MKMLKRALFSSVAIIVLALTTNTIAQAQITSEFRRRLSRVTRRTSGRSLLIGS
jgi:hypothetical protein